MVVLTVAKYMLYVFSMNCATDIMYCTKLEKYQCYVGFRISFPQHAVNHPTHYGGTLCLPQ